MSRSEEIEARLTGPGGPCELVEEDVLGERMRVFKNRKRSLRELLEASTRFGDADYMVYEERRTSYAQNRKQVASVARALRERFGVGPGDRVAILAANRPEWVQAFWAATSLGAIAVGLNGWWAQDEILYALDDCEPRVLVGDSKRLARLAGAQVALPVVEMESGFAALAEHAPDTPLPDEAIAEDAPACILYTSGTTGRPKGAVNTHRNILALIDVQLFHGLRLLLRAAAAGQLEGKAPVQHCTLVTTPLFHVSGLYTGAVTALANGLKTVWTSGRFDSLRVLELIERERVTTWGPMGTMAHRVVSHPEVGRFDLSSVRQIGSGGAPTSPELQQRIREVFPSARASMGLGYGLTEATALATLAFGEELEQHPGTVGRPLPTVQIEIRDPDAPEAPALGEGREGREGEIFLRGPLVMRGYWRREAETRAAILPGRWLRTGDIGCLRQGRLFINSRARDLILRGGENVYPVEIEQRIEAHPGVEEAAVLGVEHEELGQEVKAIVVPRKGVMLDPEELAKWVAERLAYFKVPAHWEIRLEPLPRNAAGKVLKHVLAGRTENPFQED